MSNWIDSNPYLTYYNLPSGSAAYHTGADLNNNRPYWDADAGSPVFAIANGTVTFAELVPTGTWGRLAVIRHEQPDGKIVHSRYGHLATLNVHAGQSVLIGDLIGTVGGKEWNLPNHLHFDISTSGILETQPKHWPGTNKAAVQTNYVDPKDFLLQFNPSDPQPPQPASVDLLPYIKATHRVQFDMGYSLQDSSGTTTGTQTTQVFHLSDTSWLYIKGENGEYEKLGLSLHMNLPFIFRFEDTSESPTRFFVHYHEKTNAPGAPWFPRFAVPGVWYETKKKVQHYLKQDCLPQNSGIPTDRLRLIGFPKDKTYPQSGSTVKNVVTIEWSSGEQYDFAFGIGNVAFRSPGRDFFFIQTLQGRDDKKYAKPACIPLGW